MRTGATIYLNGYAVCACCKGTGRIRGMTDHGDGTLYEEECDCDCLDPVASSDRCPPREGHRP